MKGNRIYFKLGRMDPPSADQIQGGSPMKKLLSLIIMAMFALSMSFGTFASDDKSTSTKSTSSTKKSKKSKKTSTKSTAEKAPAAAPAK